FVPLPRYWVEEREVERAVGCRRAEHPGWFLGMRKTARATDARTSIFTVFPWAAAGDKIQILLPGTDASRIACLLGLFNSFALDFACRQKVGGTDLSFFIVKQLPVLPPETYTPA